MDRTHRQPQLPTAGEIAPRVSLLPRCSVEARSYHARVSLRRARRNVPLYLISDFFLSFDSRRFLQEAVYRLGHLGVVREPFAEAFRRLAVQLQEAVQLALDP